MPDRANLSAEFKTILGNNNVYFDPPASVHMKYPGIRYKLYDFQERHAGNKKYLITPYYSATLITKDPEDPAILMMEKLEYCTFDRHYIADNLHHYVYRIYH